MKVYQKDDRFYIEGLQEAEQKKYLFATIYSDWFQTDDIIIAVDETLHVFAWNCKTKKPITELKEGHVLKHAFDDEKIVIHRDMQTVLKIHAETVRFLNDNTILAENGCSYFSGSVWRMKNSAWQEEQTQCHILSENFICYMYSAVNNRVCKFLITPEETIGPFSPSMEFYTGEECGSLIAFTQFNEFGLYDFRQKKEICRFTKEDDSERFTFSCRNMSYLWHTPYRFWKNGITGFFFEDKSPAYVDWCEGSCLCIRSEDKKRLLHTETCRLSETYSDIQEKYNNFSSEWIVCSEKNQYGIINNEFQCLLPAVYDQIHSCKHMNCYILEKNNLFGLSDMKGNVLSPVIWDSLKEHDSCYTSCLTAEKDGKQTILRPDGSFASPLEWESAELTGFRTAVLWKYQKTDQTEQKYFQLIHTESGEILLQGIFDSMKALSLSCYQVQKDDQIGIYHAEKKCWLSEMQLCSVSKENNQIIVCSVAHPERAVFPAD
ncbi:MAG: WG repeat-containing protein [Oscillospiraceae bacterium]|nr:WG repeat-containing protein [Oscillospiraceae bacterium]